jgi:hypothetical protein
MVAEPSSRVTHDEFYQKIDQLHSWNGAIWQTLPSWALFYIELGAIIGLRPGDGGCHLAVALAVPARSFVAALVASGCILARAAIRQNREYQEQHVTWLDELPPDSPVLVREKGRRLKGRFQRKIVMPSGQAHYMVRIDSGANTTKGYLPGQIQPLEDDSFWLPKTQKGRSRQEVAPLVTKLLSGAAQSFSTQTCLDCILVGSLSEFRKEIEQKLALVAENGNRSEGVLLDLLRPKRYLRTGSAFRSLVLPPHTKSKESFAKALSPHVVILDGSISYLGQRQHWQESHVVFVLDRTEPQFEPAVSQANQEYYRRNNSVQVELRLSPVPAGVEAMVFEVGS